MDDDFVDYVPEEEPAQAPADDFVDHVPEPAQAAPPAPAGAAMAAPAVPKDDFEDYVPEKTETTPGTKPAPESQFMTGVRKFVHGLPGALGGAAGGALVGGAAGAAGANPLTVLGGALVGGVAGGFMGDTAKQAGLKLLGFDDAAQQAANAEAHPWTSALSEAGTAVVGGGVRGATAQARKLGAVIGGGFETGMQLARGEELDPVKIAATTGAGALFARNYAWQDRLAARGGELGAKIKAKVAPPETPPASNSNPGSVAAGGTVEAHVEPAKNATAEAAVGDVQNKPTSSNTKYAKERDSAIGETDGTTVRTVEDPIDVTTKAALESENAKIQTPPAAETPPPAAESQAVPPPAEPQQGVRPLNAPVAEPPQGVTAGPPVTPDAGIPQGRPPGQEPTPPVAPEGTPTPKDFWSYQAPEPPKVGELPEGAIKPGTTQAEFEQLSPGMRREVGRQPAPEQPTPKPDAEPPMSPEYRAAREASDAAIHEFQQAQAAYRSRKIGDEEFLVARKKYDKSGEEFDKALEAEGNRQRAAEAAPKPTPADDQLDIPEFLDRRPKPPAVTPEPAPAVGRETVPTPKETVAAAKESGEKVGTALKKARAATTEEGGPLYPHKDVSGPKLQGLKKIADEESSRINRALIDAGRGNEKIRETFQKTDQLSRDAKAVSDWRTSINDELKRRAKYHGGTKPIPKEHRDSFYGGDTLTQDVITRGRSGRPIETEPLPIGKEEAILEAGYAKATGPKGEPREPEILAAQRKGTVGDRLKARNAAAKEYEAALEDRLAGKVDDAVVAEAKARYEAAKAASTAQPAGKTAQPAGKTAQPTATPRGQPSVTSPVGGGVPPGGGPPPPAGTATPTPAPPPPAQGTGSAQARVQAQIVSTKKSWWNNVPKTQAEFRTMLDDIYTKVKAEFHPLVRMEHEAGVQNLPGEQRPSVLARLTKGNTGRAEFKLKEHQYDIETKQRLGKGFEEILAPVKEDMQGFTNYAVARRAPELNARNVETGITTADANSVIAQGGAKYERIFQDLVKFQDQELGNLVKSGLISNETAAKMRAMNKSFVPYHRLMDLDLTGAGGMGPGLKVQKPIHGITGSERAIIDPIDSIIRNTYMFTHLAERNLVGRAMKAWVENHPQGNTFMERVRHTQPIKVSAEEVNAFIKQHGLPPSIVDDMTVFRPAAHRDRPGEIRIFEDGKAQYYRVDPPVAEAFNAMDRETFGLLTKLAAAPAKLLRAGVVLSPEFGIRNVVRDQFSAFIQSKHGYIPVYDAVKSLGSLFKHDQVYQDWMKNGGANATLTSIDRKNLSVDPKDLAGKVQNVITSPVQALRAISDILENATRLGEYRRAIGAGKSPTEAAMSARDILDHQRLGSKTKALNAIIPFMNAQLEGVDKAARSFRDNPLPFTMKAAASVTLPSVLLWAANKDDPRYRELPQWQKDLFWIVPTDKWEPLDKSAAASIGDAHKRQRPDGSWERNTGTIYRIPKPFEIGILFGTVPERMLDAFFTAKPDAFKDLHKTLYHAMTPNWQPQAVVPFIEHFANRSEFTGRPLVPKRLEGVEPQHQATEFTSETAKKLGAAIAGVSKDSSFASPIVIDNYIKQFTGGLGGHAVSGIDKVIEYGKTKKGPPKPETTLADTPGIKAIVSRFPAGDAQSIQDFYKTYNERKAEKATDTMLRKSGRADEVTRQQVPALEAAAKALGTHNKLIRGIYQDNSMTPSDKRRLIDEAYLKMIEIARRGNETFKQTERRP